MSARGNSIAIQTPEGVRFTLPLAGLISRSLALAIDLAATATIVGALDKLSALIGLLGADAMGAFAIIGYFVVNIGYSIAFEWLWHGQTPGKRVLSLRVMDVNGLKLEPAQIAVRNLMRALDSLPALYLIGAVTAFASRKSQRLGDLVAGTIVVEQQRPEMPDIERLNLDDKFNSFYSAPHLAARLRQRITPELVEISYQALLRRDELTPDVQVEIFRRLADRYRALVKFPDEITASLTDERYVRNALQVALQSGSAQRSRDLTSATR